MRSTSPRARHRRLLGPRARAVPGSTGGGGASAARMPSISVSSKPLISIGRVVDDQLLETPASAPRAASRRFLAQTVCRDAQQLELGRRQRVDGDAGEWWGRFRSLAASTAHHAVDQPTFAIDEHRGCEAEGGDRVGGPCARGSALDLPHVASGARSEAGDRGSTSCSFGRKVVSSKRCNRGRAGQALRLRPAPGRRARGEACFAASQLMSRRAACWGMVRWSLFN